MRATYILAFVLHVVLRGSVDLATWPSTVL